jgi:hypothetical protein
MQLSNNKKEPATERHTASQIAGPLNSTNHRQGKKSSQKTLTSQAQKTTTNTVNGLLVPPQMRVKHLSNAVKPGEKSARHCFKRVL